MGITISTVECTQEVKDKLKTNLHLIFDERPGKDYTLFQIDFDKSDTISNMDYLADIIADIVIDKLEKKFINRIIKHKYQYFNLEERTQIEELTLNQLNEGYNINKRLGRLVRKQEIINQILKYFNKNKDLNIEGFVRFRLKDYIEELNFAVERAVDEFIVQKEYNEFIDLLKYFVDLQEPRVSVVHVLQEEDGSFQIMDRNHNFINNEYLEGYLADILNEEVNHEDLLISALINVAPLKIVLHFNDEEVEETVRSIFDERVELCKGCELCQKK